jgi:hypothetical protein
MQLLPQALRIKADGVEIEGPHGPVRLSFVRGTLKADYIGHELVKGSAQAYAQSQLQAALVTAQAFQLPWTYDSQGQQRITNHQRFYQQTFSSELNGIERIIHWLNR